MEWKELQSLVDRKIGYGVVQPGASVRNGVPVIKVNNIISGLKDINELDTTTHEIAEKYKRTRLNGGELVISVVGTYGKTAIVPKSFAGCNLVRATCLIDIVDEKLCKWVKYYIDSPKGQAYINGNLNTTVQATLNVKCLNEMPIPFYSQEYMDKAVSILSSLDRKIELNNKINATLEEMAQALFKSWFVDFEPFKNGNFIDTEIGKIPEGWRVGTLGEVAEVSSGKRPPLRCNAKSADASIPLIGAAAVMGYTSAVLYNTPILVTGRVGTHGVVQRWCEDCWPSDNTLVITSNYYEFTYQLLKRIDYKNLNRGSTQPLITQKDLKETCVVIPPINVLNNFEQLASSIMKPSEQNVKESLTLTHLRDTLLPRLMSGEIEV